MTLRDWHASVGVCGIAYTADHIASSRCNTSGGTAAALTNT